MPIVLKSGSLNLLEPSGPVQASNGITCIDLWLIHSLQSRKKSHDNTKTQTICNDLYIKICMSEEDHGKGNFILFQCPVYKHTKRVKISRNIASFKAQRIKCLGHTQQIDQARPNRNLLDWRPMGTRPVKSGN